jgi:tetratricopeptide (TPR) repeat protein
VLQQFSTEVTDRLRLKLSGSLKQRLKRQYAAGSEAYQQYLKGRFHLNKRTGADFREAIGYFNQAILQDPDYAPAYSGLADTYGFIAAYGSAYSGMIPADALERSRAAAKRALHLDGTLAEAYSALRSWRCRPTITGTPRSRISGAASIWIRIGRTRTSCTRST